MTIDETIDITKDYLLVNADMEELIEKMLTKISIDQKRNINDNLGKLDDELSQMQFHRYLNTQKIYQLNNVHTDWDKQVTYIITTKNNKFQAAIKAIPKESRMLKVKDYEFRIQKLYEEIAVLDSTTWKINEAFISNEKIKQIDENNKVQHKIERKLFWLTTITLGFVIIQTVIGYLSLQ